MSYADRVKKMKKEGAGKEISTSLVKWETKGQRILGKFLSVATLESTQQEGKTYKQFLFHTDTGYVKAAFGFRGEEYAEQFTVGNLYDIEYLGKIKLAGEREMNDFRISEFAVAPGEVGASEDDLPF